MPRENQEAKSNIVSRTHFRRFRVKPDAEWQWFWRTETPDGRNAIAVGGEGYDNLKGGAVNGYLSQQGFAGWSPDDDMPEGYKLEKYADDHYVITRYEQP